MKGEIKMQNPEDEICKKFGNINNFIGSIYSGTRKTAVILLGAAMSSKTEYSTRNRIVVNVEGSLANRFTKKYSEEIKDEINRLVQEEYLDAKIPKKIERCWRCRFATNERGFKINDKGIEELLKIIEEIQPK